MENIDTPTYLNPRKSSGVERAAIRYAQKLKANREKPVSDSPDSRQVVRAKARQIKKNMRKHMNEHVGGKNRKRG